MTADGRTECAVLLPRRASHSRLPRIFQDRTAGRIAIAVETIPHVSATIVPFSPTNGHPSARSDAGTAAASSRHKRGITDLDPELAQRAAGTIPITNIEWRQRVKIAGRIRSLRVETAKGTPNLECEITDGTGNLLLVFIGRRQIPGVESGTRLVVEGMVGSWKHRLAILNPDYELITESHSSSD